MTHVHPPGLIADIQNHILRLVNPLCGDMISGLLGLWCYIVANNCINPLLSLSFIAVAV